MKLKQETVVQSILFRIMQSVVSRNLVLLLDLLGDLIELDKQNEIKSVPLIQFARSHNNYQAVAALQLCFANTGDEITIPRLIRTIIISQAPENLQIYIIAKELHFNLGMEVNLTEMNALQMQVITGRTSISSFLSYSADDCKDYLTLLILAMNMKNDVLLKKLQTTVFPVLQRAIEIARLDIFNDFLPYLLYLRESNLNKCIYQQVKNSQDVTTLLAMSQSSHWSCYSLIYKLISEGSFDLAHSCLQQYANDEAKTILKNCMITAAVSNDNYVLHTLANSFDFDFSVGIDFAKSNNWEMIEYAFLNVLHYQESISSNQIENLIHLQAELPVSKLGMNDLAPELLVEIASYLPIDAIYNLRLVCKYTAWVLPMRKDNFLASQLCILARCDDIIIQITDLIELLNEQENHYHISSISAIIFSALILSGWGLGKILQPKFSLPDEEKNIIDALFVGVGVGVLALLSILPISFFTISIMSESSEENLFKSLNQDYVQRFKCNIQNWPKKLNVLCELLIGLSSSFETRRQTSIVNILRYNLGYEVLSQPRFFRTKLLQRCKSAIQETLENLNNWSWGVEKFKYSPLINPANRTMQDLREVRTQVQEIKNIIADIAKGEWIQGVKNYDKVGMLLGKLGLFDPNTQHTHTEPVCVTSKLDYS